MRTDPEIIWWLWSSKLAQRTMYPGRIKAIDACARDEKQNSEPFCSEPNTRARNEVATAAVISKTLA
jgi:hypothetical protein